MPRYFLSTLVYFWIPVSVMWFYLRGRLDKGTRKAFWITLAIMAPATFAMEYVYLWTDIWNFSEEMDPLLGIRLWGAPIEEFLFWFGAPPFILLVYFLWDSFLGKVKVNDGGKKTA